MQLDQLGTVLRWDKRWDAVLYRLSHEGVEAAHVDASLCRRRLIERDRQDQPAPDDHVNLTRPCHVADNVETCDLNHGAQDVVQLLADDEQLGLVRLLHHLGKLHRLIDRAGIDLGVPAAQALFQSALRAAANERINALDLLMSYLTALHDVTAGDLVITSRAEITGLGKEVEQAAADKSARVAVAEYQRDMLATYVSDDVIATVKRQSVINYENGGYDEQWGRPTWRKDETPRRTFGSAPALYPTGPIEARMSWP